MYKTCCTYIILSGHLASVEKLLSLKARLHISDSEGQIALHSAVMAPSAMPSEAVASFKIVQIIRDAILQSSNRFVHHTFSVTFYMNLRGLISLEL